MRVFRIRAIHFFTFTAGMGFIVLLFLLPEAAKNGAWQGLLACAEMVVPSLFPFMTVSLFLTKTGLPKWVSRPLDLLCRGLFLDRHGVDILLSFTAGFPVGGLLIAEEYKAGLLNERRAAARMTYCVNSGPAFIITAVGLGMLGSAEIGLLLFLAVTAAALANGIVFSRLLLSREETPPPPPRQSEGFSSAFVGSVSAAATQMLGISGFVVFFSTLVSLLGCLPLSKRLSPILAQVLEVTVGALASRREALPMIAAGLGFGGLSVICQVLCLVRTVPFSRGIFLLSRLTHGALSALFARLLLPLFPLAREVLLSTGRPNAAAGLSLPLGLAMAFMCVTLIVCAKEEGSLLLESRKKNKL